MSHWLHKGALFAGALLFCLTPGSALQASDKVFKTTVRYVIDGDSLVLQDGRQVRLIGINTPELGKRRRRAEPLAQQARKQVQQWVLRKEVWVTPGKEQFDRYGRLLAHVDLVKGDSLQIKLLRQGLASAIAYPPNISRQRRYHMAEKDARTARIGIWDHPYYAPIPVRRLRYRDTGYRFIFGRIRRAGRGRRAMYLTLGRRVTLIVPRRYWSYWRNLNPRSYRGRAVFVRGWLTRKRGKFSMYVLHPAMLEFPG
ncbi:MAG TPA: hypothetical protein ENG78_04165 [Acidiferrobacteraceae bacterium]|nr:hypothetical protein [Acidiferrobacteraceae bacterium]HEX19998.1 hypothetical protein [Acidiferrobacteraceae bacterium]